MEVAIRLCAVPHCRPSPETNIPSNPTDTAPTPQLQPMLRQSPIVGVGVTLGSLPIETERQAMIVAMNVEAAVAALPFLRSSDPSRQR